MEYTLSSAATAAGVHKASIHRAVKSGKLSARREEDGSYRIDASELARVYTLNAPATDREIGQSDAPQPPSATGRVGESAMIVTLLREQLEREQETVADLRATVKRLFLVLPAPERPQETPRLVEELRMRLEEAEARIAMLQAQEKGEEIPDVTPIVSEPTKAMVARLRALERPNEIPVVAPMVSEPPKAIIATLGAPEKAKAGRITWPAGVTPPGAPPKGFLARLWGRK